MIQVLSKTEDSSQLEARKKIFLVKVYQNMANFLLNFAKMWHFLKISWHFFEVLPKNKVPIVALFMVSVALFQIFHLVTLSKKVDFSVLVNFSSETTLFVPNLFP